MYLYFFSKLKQCYDYNMHLYNADLLGMLPYNLQLVRNLDATKQTDKLTEIGFLLFLSTFFLKELHPVQ